MMIEVHLGGKQNVIFQHELNIKGILERLSKGNYFHVHVSELCQVIQNLKRVVDSFTLDCVILLRLKRNTLNVVKYFKQH